MHICTSVVSTSQMVEACRARGEVGTLYEGSDLLSPFRNLVQPAASVKAISNRYQDTRNDNFLIPLSVCALMSNVPKNS